MVFIKGSNIGKEPPKHKDGCPCFRCSKIPWNKGKTGSIPWNKGVKYDEKLKSKLNLDGLKLGRIWNKGKKLSEDHKMNLSKSHTGERPWRKGVEIVSTQNEKHWNWRGNDAKYLTVHTWLYRRLGKANKCENKDCIYPRIVNRNIVNSPTRFEWSNKTGNYLRDKSDWWQLCVSCHRKYDRKYSIKRKRL